MVEIKFEAILDFSILAKMAWGGLVWGFFCLVFSKQTQFALIIRVAPPFYRARYK